MMAQGPTSQEYRVLKEKVEVLNGDRGDSSKQAMRRGEVTDLQNFIAQLRKGETDIQRALKKAQTDLATAQQQITDLDTEVSTAEQSITDLNQQIAAAQSAITAAQAAITALGANGAAIAGTVSNLQDAVAAITIPALTSASVSLPPTAADFNSLRDDVVAIHGALQDMKTAIA
jgi:chromosome segregation ATPase